MKTITVTHGGLYFLSSCPSFSSAGVIGVSHHTPLSTFLRLKEMIPDKALMCTNCCRVLDMEGSELMNYSKVIINPFQS